MASAALTTVKEFLYRGEPEEFSNKYHFVGAVPVSGAEWTALMTAFASNERLIFPASVKIKRAYGYDDGDEPSIWTYEWPPGSEPVGTFAPTAGQNPAQGDSAATIRFATDKRSSRGKVVYARKYYHAVYGQAAPNEDYLASNQRTAIDSFGGVLVNSFGGSTSRHLVLPDGTLAHTPLTDIFLTTRTLKRRGKRPPT